MLRRLAPAQQAVDEGQLARSTCPEHTPSARGQPPHCSRSRHRWLAPSPSPRHPPPPAVSSACETQTWRAPTRLPPTVDGGGSRPRSRRATWRFPPVACNRGPTCRLLPPPALGRRGGTRAVSSRTPPPSVAAAVAASLARPLPRSPWRRQRPHRLPTRGAAARRGSCAFGPAGGRPSGPWPPTSSTRRSRRPRPRRGCPGHCRQTAAGSCCRSAASRRRAGGPWPLWLVAGGRRVGTGGKRRSAGRAVVVEAWSRGHP